MLISLVMPTFNRTDLLRKSLLSVLRQSLQPNELVLSDDGSSEDIISGIRDILGKINFPVKFISQEDRGFRAARCRNNGIRLAKGDFIICLDPDIVFSAHYLRTLVEAIEKKRFIVGAVIRLAEQESKKMTMRHIETCDFSSILSKPQKQIIIKQYRKEFLYSMLNKLKLRRQGPKLRSCVVGFFKDDFVKVNGFDEKYVGWGNEDDDLGVRFYAAGIRGKNPFKKDYAIHLFHQRFHNDERVNRSYQKNRMKVINKNNFRCEFGYDIYDSQDEIKMENVEL
ncbi:MAG: glycosyltransferase [Proteobacteria bacterium]|nr:glycosyltransferase [Pseudomonadota bacterium]MBU4469952.1 glycosyltransferase [Pseudomonadota bacterium]MCG2753714.1 glycosyltransferase [Desulfobacteraceae bacterium]